MTEHIDFEPLAIEPEEQPKQLETHELDAPVPATDPVRIRQIEAEALTMLRHPSRGDHLRQLLNG